MKQDTKHGLNLFYQGPIILSVD